jgi:6-pyruvoyltetrahydropterin/6-carboxytetrahydropterin synthase
MFEISKSFSFSASHQLDYLPPSHPCSRLHGHNYTVTLYLRGTALNDRHFLYDYRDLDTFKAKLDHKFDHQHLNDVLGKAEYTTAEALACSIYDWARSTIPLLYAVEVKETEKTCARFIGQ